MVSDHNVINKCIYDFLAATCFVWSQKLYTHLHDWKEGISNAQIKTFWVETGFTLVLLRSTYLSGRLYDFNNIV